MRDAKGRFVRQVKVIKGQPHKLCAGPGHEEPTYLPATDKYFYIFKNGRRKGALSSKCRLCSNWAKLKSPGLSGTVPIEQARPYFIEGVNRVGLMEFCRRTRISDSTVRYILSGQLHAGRRMNTVQKRLVRRAMLEVISMRRKNEVRHRDSISHGSAKRGRSEKTVTRRTDLYRPHGSADTELRAKSRERLTS